MLGEARQPSTACTHNPEKVYTDTKVLIGCPCLHIGHLRDPSRVLNHHSSMHWMWYACLQKRSLQGCVASLRSRQMTQGSSSA
mmetsp:Transcript_134726/g.430365  ORF Transcript_134726/g.430365 Transcript_134726/m.430365 type:complete len:83 (-) Transcript_134726:405-653(-)